MTNGGGASEEDRSKRLSEQLGFEVRPKISSFRRSCCFKITTSNFMQSHTILKSSMYKYTNRPVLVLGGRGDILRKVAERCKKIKTLVSPHLMTTGYQLRFQTCVYNFGHQGMEPPVSSLPRSAIVSRSCSSYALSASGHFMTSRPRSGHPPKFVRPAH